MVKHFIKQFYNYNNNFCMVNNYYNNNNNFCMVNNYYILQQQQGSFW